MQCKNGNKQERLKEFEEVSVVLESGQVCSEVTRSCAEGATWTRASSELPASGSSE